MQTEEMKWQDIVKNADAYKQIGQTEIWLYRRTGNEPPWHLAVTCEPGGSHRMDISTDVRFCGKHESGLTFRWNFDIETRDANGCGMYKIDRAGISEVLAKLPVKAAQEFQNYLADCAVAIRKKGDEFQNAANSQFADAHLLRVLAKPIATPMQA